MNKFERQQGEGSEPEKENPLAIVPRKSEKREAPPSGDQQKEGERTEALARIRRDIQASSPETQPSSGEVYEAEFVEEGEFSRGGRSGNATRGRAHPSSIPRTSSARGGGADPDHPNPFWEEQEALLSPRDRFLDKFAIGLKKAYHGVRKGKEWATTRTKNFLEPLRLHENPDLARRRMEKLQDMVIAGEAEYMGEQYMGNPQYLGDLSRRVNRTKEQIEAEREAERKRIAERKPKPKEQPLPGQTTENAFYPNYRMLKRAHAQSKEFRSVAVYDEKGRFTGRVKTYRIKEKD